jgi:hypothetical protein
VRSSSLLLLLATAGCYRGSSTPADRPAPPAPAGPAPHLRWADNGFDASHVPAVSADGAALLIGLEDNDGGRGNPNYRLELRDRRDAILAKQVVLTVDEAESMFDASGKTAALDQRIAAANRWLADQHAARRFVPFTELEVETGDEIASAFRATGHGVTLEWRKRRLTLTHDGQTLVARETPDSWGSEELTPGDLEMCQNPAFLGAASVNLERKVALVTISYSGNDRCWEPSNAPHVVAW